MQLGVRVCCPVTASSRSTPAVARKVEGGRPDGVAAEPFADHGHGEDWGAEPDGVVEDAEGEAVVDAGGPLVEGVEGGRAADHGVGPDPAGEEVVVGAGRRSTPSASAVGQTVTLQPAAAERS